MAKEDWGRKLKIGSRYEFDYVQRLENLWLLVATWIQLQGSLDRLCDRQWAVPGHLIFAYTSAFQPWLMIVKVVKVFSSHRWWMPVIDKSPQKKCHRHHQASNLQFLKKSRNVAARATDLHWNSARALIQVRYMHTLLATLLCTNAFFGNKWLMIAGGFFLMRPSVTSYSLSFMTSVWLLRDSMELDLSFSRHMTSAESFEPVFYPTMICNGPSVLTPTLTVALTQGEETHCQQIPQLGTLVGSVPFISISSTVSR